MGALQEAQETLAEKLQAMNERYAEKAADGQEFGDDGKPKTNPEGKKLTPADMFNPGDVITVTVGKSNPKQDAGLKVEQGKNGKYYVRKVPASGLFAKTPVIPGDKILELNGVDVKDFEDINAMKRVIRDEEKLTIVVLRREPDASESSADSEIDFDNLAPITPSGVKREEIEEKDDDTVGYDGHDCGCVWCPDCHP
jgi:C-terminal processing protease CtpA/Prc